MDHQELSIRIGRIHQGEQFFYMQMMFGNKSGEVKLDGEYHYNEFIPNSIVIFPGMIPHRAETTTRLFTGLRKTVAWKLQLIK